MASIVSNPAVRKLEDDNFIIGSGLKYDRMRQDARQLQRSKFKETRSKANFARFRNAALKCAVEATGKSIDQEKSMRMREIERERGKVIAIQKRCGKCLLTAKLNATAPEDRGAKEKRKITKKIIPIEEDSGGCHSLSPYSACAESWMQRNQSADLDLEGNDLTSNPEREPNSSICHAKTSAKSDKVLLDVEQFTPRSQTTLSRKRSSLPSLSAKNSEKLEKDFLNVDQLTPRSKTATSSKKRDSLPYLSDTSSVLSATKDETKNSASLLEGNAKESMECSSRLCRSSSMKTVRIHSLDAVNVKRRNTIGNVRHLDDKRREKIHEKEKNKEFQVWKNFDELLKWFADYMQIEYKPHLVMEESDVTKDAHAQTASRVLMPKGSISPLYFQYGMPENFVIRLC